MGSGTTYRWTKRTLDVVLSALALLATSWLGLLVAAIVRCSSPGPILFRQTRLGRARKPFQILISDGVDTCGGENPSADVAALNSQHGVTTWVLNLGDPTNCQTGLLGSIARPGGGECIDVANKEDLRRTIEDILGQIREEARAFAAFRAGD